MVTCATLNKPKSSEVYSASADLIGSNQDLLDKIFLDLPVRSLIRFKSVSKQWNALISDHRFGLTHTFKNPPSRIPSGLIFYYKAFGKIFSNVHSVSLNKMEGKIPSFAQPSDDSMEIVQSCNGLTLFRFKENYCVRNLSTNQLEFIPVPELYPSVSRGVWSWSLAFDPSVSSHYKILCIQHVDYLTYKFLTFSSETGQWKDTNVTTYAYYFPEKSVYLKGAIYSLAFRRPHHNTWACYCFDTETENLTVTFLPFWHPYDKALYIRYFGECNGHLYFIYYSRHVFGDGFLVFELDHVRKKWVVKYYVKINRLIPWFPKVVAEKVVGYRRFPMFSISILSVVRGEKEEDSALILNIPGKVVSYNFTSKKIELLSELPLQEIRLDHLVHTFVIPFVPTLCPL